MEEEEEEKWANVIRINMNCAATVESILEQLTKKGINMEDLSELRQVKNTWLVLDDAQIAYNWKFDLFWHFVVKSLGSAGVEDNLFVVVAATYDLSTRDSPADFNSLEHIEPNIIEEEVKALFAMHDQVY